jgi:uncharacterized repeat protein (TIGR01451 family)
MKRVRVLVALAAASMAMTWAGCATQESPPAAAVMQEPYDSWDPIWYTYRPEGEPQGRVLATTMEPVEPERQPAEPRAKGPAWLAVPTGQRESSALLLEKFLPQEVIAGQPFNYELRVTNLTDLSLDNVMVTDSLPPEFRVVSSEPKIQPGAAGASMWALGTLAPREARSIKLSGSASSGVRSLTSCAAVTYNTSLCTTINVVQPALEITMSAPGTMILCDPIPVRIQVANNGTGAARNVRITQALPAGMKTAEGRSAAEFTVPTLAAGQTREFTFNAKADRPGLYSSLAMATAEPGLKASSSETSTRVTQPVLALSVKGPERLFLGRNATYEITVANTGDAPARDLVLENPLPAGAAFQSCTEGGRATETGILWTLGELAPAAQRTVRVTFAYSAIGDLKEGVSAKAYCAATASAKTVTAIAGIPALLLDGFDDPDPVQIGDTTVYTLTVTNQGSAPLTNVRLICTMETGGAMEYSSSKGVTTGQVSGQTITFAPIATLEAKQKATYKITVKAAKEGQVQFKAEVTSDQITRPLSKVETTHFYR